jgi:hypothetical protein
MNPRMSKVQMTSEIVNNNPGLIHPDRCNLLYSDLNQKFGI